MIKAVFAAICVSSAVAFQAARSARSSSSIMMADKVTNSNFDHLSYIIASFSPSHCHSFLSHQILLVWSAKLVSRINKQSSTKY